MRETGKLREVHLGGRIPEMSTGSHEPDEGFSNASYGDVSYGSYGNMNYGGIHEELGSA